MKTKLIHTDPTVMMGKPVIAGTRITVELILEKLAAGETVEQLLEAHPRLTRPAVFAALAYAAETMRTLPPKKAGNTSYSNTKLAKLTSDSGYMSVAQP